MGPNAPEPCLRLGSESCTLVALDSLRWSVDGAGEGDRTSVLPPLPPELVRIAASTSGGWTGVGRVAVDRSSIRGGSLRTI